MRKDRCPGCLRPNTRGNTTVYGGRTWHADCLEKLQANVLPRDDKAMFQKLNRAFNKLIRER